MSSVVGFTLARGLTPGRERAALAAQRRALRHFPALVSESLLVGDTALAVWGHPDFRDRVCRAPDGTMSVLVGSPHGEINWASAPAALLSGAPAQDEGLPWEGRTVVIEITDGGRRWDLWNDWIGSIPVYHAQLEGGWIASTLEPVVVAAAGFSRDDISVPALLSLLINGHFLNEVTLFAGMKVVAADCHAVWRGDRFEQRPLWTVTPSCERWEAGWSDLVDEMHEVVYKTIRAALIHRPRWIIPLSSGMDSRLIAAVASQLGLELRAYSWGGHDATDVVLGRRVAKQLGLPWQRVDLGTGYLLTQTGPWADVFGSSMHLHGMYQMEFFTQLRSAPEGQVVSGYLGDVLCGEGIDMVVSVVSRTDNCQLYDDGYTHWTVDEAADLVVVPTSEALEEVRGALRSTIGSVPGAVFQKVTLLDFRTRQRRFTGFSPWLADYERGVATPFMSREYARFCLSLPRAALDRRLLADMFRRYYPALASIPGSYAPEPYQLTGRYLLQRRLSRSLPFVFGRGRNGLVPLAMDLECVRVHRWKALWPIRDAWSSLGRWVDLTKVSRVADAIFAGSTDIRTVRKLQSLQCLAYRLHEDPNTQHAPE